MDVEEVAVEEEGHDELPELPEEESAFEDHGEGEQEEEGVEADQEQDEEVEQEEEGVEADQEQHEEVEQEEEGVEADQEQHEEVAVEQEEEVVEMQEGDRRGEGDEWSDFSSRDPVLTLSLFGAVCFRVWFVGWFSFIGWLYCSNEKTFIQSQSLSLSPSSLSSLSRGSSIAFIWLRLEILEDRQIPAGIIDFYFSLYAMSKLRAVRLANLGSAFRL